jgi:membrane-associated HD superfamily phosphohydrolase
MMADSVEAASRSLSDHSVSAITSLVNRIIDAQIEEGLHNESPISFRDIKVIKEAFINRVSTMYHSRVVYPTDTTPTTTQSPTLQL